MLEVFRNEQMPALFLLEEESTNNFTLNDLVQNTIIWNINNFEKSKLKISNILLKGVFAIQIYFIIVSLCIINQGCIEHPFFMEFKIIRIDNCLNKYYLEIVQHDKHEQTFTPSKISEILLTKNLNELVDQSITEIIRNVLNGKEKWSDVKNDFLKSFDRDQLKFIKEESISMRIFPDEFETIIKNNLIIAEQNGSGKRNGLMGLMFMIWNKKALRTD